MADQPTGDATATDAPTEPTEPKPTETVEFWKSKAREQEKRAKANAAAADELATFKESQKTETQRLTDQLAAEKAQRETVERQAMRLRVAASKGVPADLIDRLQGDSEDELSADADTLLKLVSAGMKSGNHVPREGVTPPSPKADPLREWTRDVFAKAE